MKKRSHRPLCSASISSQECPCCRDPLVSDEEVWETVKSLRKEKRRQLRKDNGFAHRLIQWVLARRRRGHMVSAENRSSTSSMGGTSSEGDDLESPSASHQSERESVQTAPSSPPPSMQTQTSVGDQNSIPSSARAEVEQSCETSSSR
jgi:hypothetical protein